MKTKLQLLFFAVLFSVGLQAQSLTVTSSLPATIETGDSMSFTVDYTTDASNYNLIVRFYESDGVLRYGTAQSFKGVPSSTTSTETLSIDAPLVAGSYVARIFLETTDTYAKTYAPDIPFTVTDKVTPIKTVYLFDTDGDGEGWEYGHTGAPNGTATVAGGELTVNKGSGAWNAAYIQQNEFKLDPAIHRYIHISYYNDSENGKLQASWITSGATRTTGFYIPVTKYANSTVSVDLTTNTIGGSMSDEWTTADAIGFRLKVLKADKDNDTSGGDFLIRSIIFSSSATPPNVFTAAVDNDFTNDANWSSGTAPATTEAIIIPADKGVDVTNLTVDPAGSLTIESGGSLKVSGTASGNVTYNRTVDFVSGDLKGWFLMGAPVASQDYNDAFVTANDIATKGTNRGIATYTTSSDDWLYHQGAASATFTAGTGYAVKRQSTSGTVSFTGTINVNNAGVTVPLSRDGNRINLLGNPYTAYLSSATFLDNEIAISDTKTMWVFNKDLGVNGQYEVKTVGQDFIIAPGQGFFVQANAAGTDSFNFSEANQSHNGADTFQKGTNKGEITLSITDGAINNYGKIYYLNNATKGLDIGYDGELFNGQTNDFAIYTHLVSDTNGKKYQVQALPESDFEAMIIPVGVKATAGKQITIAAAALNLPEGIKVFLEDKQNKSFTRLDEANSSYKFTTTEDVDGIGRFYLHTSANSVLATANVSLNTISMYTTSNTNLRIVGLSEGKNKVKLFNILGKQILNTSFISDGFKDITLPKLSTGIYIVQLETATGKLSKKITLE